MKVCGLETNFKVFGSGESVLFLHGWGSDVNDFLGSAQVLSKSFQTICLDFWGFGKSEQPKTEWTSEDYANAVFEFVKKLNLQSLHLVGHSFGGKVAILFAKNHPQVCKSLILVDSAGIVKKLSFLKRLKQKRYQKLKKLVLCGKKDKSVLEKFGSQDFKNSQGVMRKIFLKVIKEDLAPELFKVKTKTLIFWGRQDKTTPLFMAKKFYKKLENSKLKVVQGGHFSHIDSFELFNEQCLNFWREL